MRSRSPVAIGAVTNAARRFHLPEQGIAGRAPRDHGVPAVMLGMGIAVGADPGIAADDVGLFADAVGADLAAELDLLGQLLRPGLVIALLEDAAVMGFDMGRPRAAMAAVAQDLHLIRRQAVFGDDRLGDAQARHPGAEEGDGVSDQPPGARVGPREIADSGDVAGLADDGEGPAPVEQGTDGRQGCCRPVAGGGAGEDLGPRAAGLHPGAQGRGGIGTDMEDEIHLARLQQMLGHGRDDAAGGGLEAKLGIGGMALQQAMIGPPHAVGARRIAGAQGLAVAGTELEQPGVLGAVEGGIDEGAEIAFQIHPHADGTAARHPCAKAAAGAETEASDLRQGCRPAHPWAACFRNGRGPGLLRPGRDPRPSRRATRSSPARRRPPGPHRACSRNRHADRRGGW